MAYQLHVCRIRGLLHQKAKCESDVYLGELQKLQVLYLFLQYNNIKLHYDGSTGYSPANS